jgi:hypothetical protein
MSDDPLSPIGFLNKAIKAVPAVKYALGVGGIVAVIAIVAGFKVNLVAVFGSVIMFSLMAVLVVFANLASERASSFHLPAMVFTWFSLILVMATALALFSSVFADWPLKFADISSSDPTPHVTSGMIVSEATYGLNCNSDHAGNLTQEMKKACDGKKVCSFAIARPPSYVCFDPKADFDFTYVCGQTEKTGHVTGESAGDTAFLTCSDVATP